MWFNDENVRVQPQRLVQVLNDIGLQHVNGCAALPIKVIVGLDAHLQVIKLVMLAVYDDLVVARQFGVLEQHLLDLSGEEIDAAHDQHIICAALHTRHPHRCSTTGTGFVG